LSLSSGGKIKMRFSHVNGAIVLKAPDSLT
jgi:hypothetical protein